MQHALTQINEEQPWFCEMHPDPALRSCAIEDESQSNGQHADRAVPTTGLEAPPEVILGVVRVCWCAGDNNERVPPRQPHCLLGTLIC